MNIFNPIKRAAEADAVAGVPLEIARNAWLQHAVPAPATVDDADPRLQRARDQLLDEPVIAELEADRRATELDVPPWASYLWLFVALCFVVENLSAWDLMRVLDMPDLLRLALGFAVSSFVLLLTGMAAQRAEQLQKAGQGQKNVFSSSLIIGLYSVVVLSAVIARYAGLGVDEDSTAAGDLASAVLLACGTVGPALLCKKLVPLWLEGRRLRNMRKQTEERYRRTARDVAAAHAFIASAHTATTNLHAERMRRGAEFEAHYRRKQAELNRIPGRLAASRQSHNNNEQAN